MKRKIVVGLMAGLLLGTVGTYFADTDGLNRSITTINATASFTHDISTGGGQSIMVEQQISELRLSDGKYVHVDVHDNTVVGGNRTVISERKVTDGYRYTQINWTKGYVNGLVHSFRNYPMSV